MTAAADMVLEDALRIAAHLTDSVGEREDAELSPAWRAEIDRRIELVRDGMAKLIPHDEVMAGAHRKLDEQRAAKGA